MQSPRVLTGLDVLEQSEFSQVEGQRVGLVVNQASVNSRLRHIVDVLVESRKCQVVKIFVPEFGFRAEFDSNVRIEKSIDARTNLPIESLYGDGINSTIPRSEDVRDLDVMVVDLQEFGSRFCTFAHTLLGVMKIARELNKRVLVLDRPNPLGGEVIEGPLVSEECRSFCGMAALPVRHGMTLGELAVLLHRGIEGGSGGIAGTPCILEILPLEGWTRAMYFPDTGLPWVMPAPTMVHWQSALMFSGCALFEGTGISEGRGTALPFELIGAPYIDGYLWAQKAMEEGIALAGAVLRPAVFTPRFSKYADRYCQGVQLCVTDLTKFRALRWAMALLASVVRLYKSQFAWRNAPYEFGEGLLAIDQLFGSHLLRKQIDINRSITPLMEEIEQAESWFAEARKTFLLY